jgi:hypothetical protein
MGCDVYANSDEIACKAGDGKVIAASPDVCLSPPSPPAGPIPVPYPDSSFSKDMQNGSKTVMIKDKEVMLKDQSFYQTSPLGDEAATKGLGAGVVTHVITGKTYFVAWSMDVQFEGLNVDRHTDLTTSNHASPQPNVPAPFPNMAAYMQAMIEADLCPCCQERAHSRGPILTEDQFYGAEDIVCEDQTQPHQIPNPAPAGPGVPPMIDNPLRTRVLPQEPTARNFLAQTRNGPCNGLLPAPPCNVYRVSSVAEAHHTRDRWHRSMDPRYRRDNNVAADVTVGHRTPIAAGGCPRGNNDGNVTPVSPECEATEDELGRRQNRIEQLRALNCQEIPPY